MMYNDETAPELKGGIFNGVSHFFYRTRSLPVVMGYRPQCRRGRRYRKDGRSGQRDPRRRADGDCAPVAPVRRRDAPDADFRRPLRRREILDAHRQKAYSDAVALRSSGSRRRVHGAALCERRPIETHHRRRGARNAYPAPSLARRKAATRGDRCGRRKKHPRCLQPSSASSQESEPVWQTPPAR